MQGNDVRAIFIKELDNINSTNELEALRIKYLGKNGILTEQVKKIGTLAAEQRKEFGAATNKLRTEIEELISDKQVMLEDSELNKKLKSEHIDITIPSRSFERGNVHPISKTIEDIANILKHLGFKYREGPDIDDDWYNFTGLNIGEHHPARQMQDTFYLAGGKLLRTHTSNTQIRVMESTKPPFRVFTTGKVYRSDYDATHTPMFHQVEIMYIDKAVTMGHLKNFLISFLKLFFNVDEAPIRLRPNYFPFTEPSAEVDIRCDRSDKEQIKIGQGNDWLEVLGCGMVHPNVLKNCGIDPNVYQGFAAGAGIDRLAMLKYNISDVRCFFESDIRWLKYYGF